MTTKATDNGKSETDDPKPLNVYGCIAHPCTDERDAGSGFCKTHRQEHKDQGLKKKLWDAVDAYQKTKGNK